MITFSEYVLQSQIVASYHSIQVDFKFRIVLISFVIKPCTRSSVEFRYLHIEKVNHIKIIFIIRSKFTGNVLRATGRPVKDD